MRVHRLRLRAFGPFAGEHRIDFDPLGVGGLFLLDGPTGAGKSTILDAITFALYGPGERAGNGRLHSHFAEPGVAPEVELEFSLRGTRHRITRSPEHTRPKRRGDGMTVEPARVHLERYEDGRWASRSSNKAEVGDLLADDLGLTREQFTQVVLLPQGEFMRFLRADDDDRRVLLTKLFGTELYDRITDELERRRKVADAEVADAATRVQRAVAAAAEAAGLDDAAAAELAGLTRTQRGSRMEELSTRIRAEAVRSAIACDDATAELTAARETAARAGATAQEAARFVAVAAELAEHEAGRAEQQQLADAIAGAERAAPVRPLLAALADAQADARKAERALIVLAPDAPDEWRAGAGADELGERAAAATTRAGELTHLVARESGLLALRERIDELAARCSDAASRLARLQLRQQELPDLLAEAASAVRIATNAAGSLAALRLRSATLGGQLDAADALVAIEPVRQAAATRREEAFARYVEAVDEHQRLMARRLAGMAAELAAGLAEGTACPVCGATEHPAPAATLTGAVTADDVGAAAERRRTAEAKRDAVAAQVAELDREVEVLRVRAGELPTETLRAELDAVTAALADAVRLAGGRADLEATKARLEAERDGLTIDRLAVEKDCVAAEAELSAAQSEAAELACELAEAAGDYPSVADRQRALQTQAALAEKIAATVRALRTASEAHEGAEARALAESRTQGFADLPAAEDAALAADDLAAARSRVAAWQAEDTRLRGILVEFGAADAEQAAALLAAARVAAVAVEAAERAAANASVAADRVARIRDRFERARTQLQLAQDQHDELVRASAPVVHLAKLARGMAGQRRVALTTYVLRHWFEQVVSAANVRLAGMSSGRYELVRTDKHDGPAERTSRAERVGLTLQVLDRHTGERRSTRSLSGGETFYTSLALALGLADVVRAEAGGVDLDTLFIDEGFGSLDADTLDDVMAVIDELRGHGRTVGIVSHVTELKDRISERIEVHRLPDGSSGLRVVA